MNSQREGHTSQDVTIVTAFFDIGRGDWLGEVKGRPVQGFRRSNELYMQWFKNLAPINNDMVIFTELQFAESVLNARREHGLESITTILTYDNLLGPDGYLHHQRESVARSMGFEFQEFVDSPACPEYWNPDYILVNALKTVFVCTTIKLGLNLSPQLAWIDFGYCRDGSTLERKAPWRFDCDGRMHIFYIREPDERPVFDIIRSGDVYFQACHIVGPADCWFELRELMDDTIKSMLSCGLVDDDQTQLLVAYRRAPELFRIHAVDPSDWFVLFRRFGEFCLQDRSDLQEEKQSVKTELSG